MTGQRFLAMANKYDQHTQAIETTFDEHPRLNRLTGRDTNDTFIISKLQILRLLAEGNRGCTKHQREEVTIAS
jgi:hypothetical protein